MFQTDRDTDSGVHLERLEVEALRYFRSLMSVDERVREVTVALVESQVQETAAKVLATGMSGSTDGAHSKVEGGSAAVGKQCAVKLPVNLWRKVLAEADQ